MTIPHPWLLVAALSGGLATAAGAYGAHGLDANQAAIDAFKSGVQYNLWHSLALPAGLLASGFSEALQHRRTAFEQLVGDVMEDGVIDSDERVRLREVQEELGLSKDEAEAILKDRRN